MIAAGSVVTCTCRHRPVLWKENATHVLIRRKRGWWLLEGKVVMVKCADCGRLVEGKAREPP